MVAPIDAKATFEVEGETITLRLNFRTLSMAHKQGVDLMAGNAEMDIFHVVTLVRCLAVADHPEMDDEEAFAIVAKGRDAATEAITSLVSEFGAEATSEDAPKGNRKGA